ncbi:PepSY domain-containing protein [Lysinibacillus antri]|uniref:PepSY domain-containing protein n=1 Tax=Lysinibacillus antri TaxID=2498145 RepID=A0A432L8T1_9BACI|nr:PepSY domain-containing protein [Lysinibacillus antri]RUL49344.1 hypothetical protein EK386_15395 [Lysinibacillus antri]
MKKIILVPALLGVMGLGGVIAVAGGNIVGSANQANVLTKVEIEKKALDVVQGKITELEFENEGTKSYYEVEIVTSDAEYDLKLDAFTGDLLRKKKEPIIPTQTNTTNVKSDNVNDENTNHTNSNQSKQTITTTAPNVSSQPRVNDDGDDRYDDDRYEDDDDDQYDDDRYEDDDDHNDD